MHAGLRWDYPKWMRGSCNLPLRTASREKENEEKGEEEEEACSGSANG
jgi:hypothetical protein